MSSSTSPAAKAPGPRRRRKPTSKATAAVVSSPSYANDSSSSNDGLYSLGASATASSTGRGNSGGASTVAASSRNHAEGASRSSRMAVAAARSSRKSVTENENSNNDASSRSRRAIITGDESITMLGAGMAKVNIGKRSHDNNDDNTASTHDSIYSTSSTMGDSMLYNMRSFPPKGVASKNIHTSLMTDSSAKSNESTTFILLQNALRTIEMSSTESTTTNNHHHNNNYNICKLFHNIPQLVEVVATQSYSLKRCNSSLLLLEENVTQLIDTAKRCLKSLSTSSSSSNGKSKKSTNVKELETALLRVALHSLRAVVTTIITTTTTNDNKSHQTSTVVQIVYKLLYHCVIIAGDACLVNFESFTKHASTTTLRHGREVWEYAILCLGAYEGLGRCLQPSTCLLLSSNNNNNNSNAVSWDELIPLPNNIHESSLTIVPQQQHVKIVMESALCTSSSILYLSLMSLYTNVRNNSMPSSWTVPNEFHFTSSIIYETCMDGDSHEKKEDYGTIFQKLLSNVTFPYVMHSIFMDNEKNIGSSSSSNNAPLACLTTENLRHVNKLFRFLWDGARVIDDLCKISNQPPLRISCLDFQITAIHVILLSLKEVLQHSSNNISQAVLKEMFTLFDKASSSAMKSTGVFYNAIDETETSMESSILEFHEFIGAQLEMVGTQLCSTATGGNEVRSLLLPASYYEYCVYRSIHRWKLRKSVYGHISTPISTLGSSEDVDSLVGASTLSVIDLALVAMKNLRLDSEEPINTSNAECESIISNFERIVIHNSTSVSQNRCRSMLILLDLQRETTNIFSQSETPYSAKGSWIALLATLLCRCVAALETKLSQCTKDQSRSLNFCLASADSCAKSASLYNVASEDKSLTTVDHDTYIINTDTQLHKSYEILLNELSRLEKNLVNRKTPIILAIEMFAKVATFIGKQRYDRKEYRGSIQPHILASDILAKVAIKYPNSDLFHTYQLSSRFMLLSSSLDAAGAHAESCAAVTFSAWCSIECLPHSSDKTIDEGDLNADKILLFHESSQGTISQEIDDLSGLSSILLRLTRVYVEYRRQRKLNSSKNNHTALPDNSLPQELMNTLLGKVITASSIMGDDEASSEFCLSKLLECAVWNKKRYEENLSAAQIAGVVREVLRCVIKIMKSNVVDDDELFSHIADELMFFLRAQNKRRRGIIDSDFLQSLSSSFHVLFAVLLVEVRYFNLPRQFSWLCKCSITKQEMKILQLSCMHLQLAEKQFLTQFTNEDIVHDACFFVQWAAVQFHYAILLEHLFLAKSDDAQQDAESSSASSLVKQIHIVMVKHSKALRNCCLAIDKLYDSHEEAYPAVVESLISTLKRLMRWFMYHGDQISAARCFVSLQKATPFSNQSDITLDLVIDLLSVSSKFEDLTKVFRGHLVDSAYATTKMNDTYQEMTQRCLALTSHIVGCKSSVVSSTAAELRELLRKLCEFLDASTDDNGEIIDDAKTADSDMTTQINLAIQRRIFVTTMLMLHAKLCVDVGKPSVAIEFLVWCHAQCKQLVTCLRLARSFLNSSAFDDIASQVDDMLTMCYERLASAFSLLGIRRQSEDHALLSMLKQQLVSSNSFGQIELQDLFDLIDCHNGHECLLHLIRSIMKIKCQSSSQDTLASQDITMKSIVSTTNLCSDDDSLLLNRMLCKSKNAVTFHDSFQYVPGFRTKTRLYMEGFLKDLSQYDGQNIADTSLQTSSFVMRICDDLKLRLIGNDSSKSIALDEITRSKFSSGMCNAEAYYQLGLTGLSSARKSGELHRLWTGNAVFHDDDNPPNANIDDAESKVDSYLLEARHFFQCALETAPPASHDLTRNIFRCLALVTGPIEGESETGLTVASLIHMSVGGCSRNIVQNELLEGILRELFQDFEDESLDYSARMKSFGLLLLRSGKTIPTNWNISTLASCPTGELIVSSIYTFVDGGGEKTIQFSNVCRFPASGTAPDESSWIGIHTDILHPFDKIIERSQNQLHGLTEEVQDTQYDENSSRREWWKERHSCDTDLQTLLSYAEREYFSHEPLRQCLIPDHLFCSERQSTSDDDNDENSDCSDLGSGKLESMFDAAHCDVSRVPKFDRERQQLILMKLTVAAIKTKLFSFGVLESTTKKKNKSELIDLLLSNMEIAQHEDEENSLIDSATMNRADIYSNDANIDQIRMEEEPCTILILDEHLQRFPIESMDMFSNVAITRVPSLAFIFALLLECEMKHHSTAVATLPAVDPMKVKYVVDPESNLTETASTLGTALTLLSNTNGWKWDGVAGQMPTSEFMSQALTTDNGLYLYCGHGGGEKAYTRLQVEGLMNIRKDGIRGCRAPVVLMGCSSGKLQSVNTPKSTSSSSSYYTMHYEPEGIALSYLLAGAPCVVGNLWDVTDRDIDRYCLTLMEDFFQSQTEDTNDCQTPIPSLAKCVAKARRACKLRFIVGSAPVCYGLPVTRNQTVKLC